jgi:glycosyltransferase involved in cell wall biosynthesis
VLERVQRRAFRRFDAVVAVSRALGDLLASRGVRRDRLSVVPNVFDDTAYQILSRAAARARLGVPSHGFRVGWVGRLTPEKGPDLFLSALPSLADLPVTVSVVGDGPRNNGLAARASALGVGERITWHGVVRNAGALLGALDVLVLSSRTEGTPIVLLEAMAAGVPIVATNVGGVPDLLSQREAYLVPPETPDALAAAIRSVYEVPAGAAQRARAARDRLRRDCGITSWLDSYEAVYRRVATSAGAATE